MNEPYNLVFGVMESDLAGLSDEDFGTLWNALGTITRARGFQHGQALKAEGWDAGVQTALNHAIRNDDGVTLRLEHLDGRPWPNPYRAAGPVEERKN